MSPARCKYRNNKQSNLWSRDFYSPMIDKDSKISIRGELTAVKALAVERAAAMVRAANFMVSFFLGYLEVNEISMVGLNANDKRGKQLRW